MRKAEITFFLRYIICNLFRNLTIKLNFDFDLIGSFSFIWILFVLVQITIGIRYGILRPGVVQY
jgi:hypothetical protein